jgi:uncharacterized protein
VAERVTIPTAAALHLAVGAIRALGGTVDHASISSLQDDVFYSTVVLAHGDALIDLDARPSDAIALALRFGVPIVVPDEILETKGVKLDETSPTSDTTDSPNPTNPGMSEERAGDES